MQYQQTGYNQMACGGCGMGCQAGLGGWRSDAGGWDSRVQVTHIGVSFILNTPNMVPNMCMVYI
jgi:hypothetical protein